MGNLDLKKIKVVVGLSGGVDSSVAALLLKQAGFDVRGVYLKCYWTYEGCSSDQDRNSAARVASVLNIPFEVWDFEREYREKVIEYFFEEYKKGRTPNPDVVCNREIKFGLFLKKAFTDKIQRSVILSEAKDLDSSGRRPQNDGGRMFIATGHYARIGIWARGEGIGASDKQEEIIFPRFSQYEEVRDSGGIRYVDIKEYLGYLGNLGGLGEDGLGTHGKLALFGGVDSKKDQSYFLYDIPQGAYEHILYPLGNLTKKQVREIALRENLPTAGRPDSSGICFIGEVNIEKFLKERIPESRGDVIDKKGNVIGEHKGVQFYTVGQRHGFRIFNFQFSIFNQIPNPNDQNGNKRPPYYVIGKNVERNELTVGMGEECKREAFAITNFQFFNSQRDPSGRSPQDDGGGIYVRVRNLGEMIPCRVAYTEAGSGTFPDSLKGSPLDFIEGSSSTLAVKHTLTSNGDADAVNSPLFVNLAYPVFGIAPGQSAVFYRRWVEENILRPNTQDDGDRELRMTGDKVWEVVGGGVIQ